MLVRGPASLLIRATVKLAVDRGQDIDRLLDAFRCCCTSWRTMAREAAPAEGSTKKWPVCTAHGRQVATARYRRAYFIHPGRLLPDAKPPEAVLLRRWHWTDLGRLTVRRANGSINSDCPTRSVTTSFNAAVVVMLRLSTHLKTLPE